MTSFTITVDDAAVRAELARLAARVDNLQPVLSDIGQQMVRRARARFASSTAPDGARWKPNSAVTLQRLADSIGPSGRKKDGSLNARGRRAVGAKKPLVGESHSLETQIAHQADRRSVTVSAPTEYAAMQHFGGSRSEFPHLWGDIPARPFMPIRADGTLYPQEQRLVLDTLADWLTGA